MEGAYSRGPSAGVWASWLFGRPRIERCSGRLKKEKTRTKMKQSQRWRGRRQWTAKLNQSKKTHNFFISIFIQLYYEVKPHRVSASSNSQLYEKTQVRVKFTQRQTVWASYPETGRARPSWDDPSMLSGSGGWEGAKKETEWSDDGCFMQ